MMNHAVRSSRALRWVRAPWRERDSSPMHWRSSTTSTSRLKLLPPNDRGAVGRAHRTPDGVLHRYVARPADAPEIQTKHFLSLIHI